MHLNNALIALLDPVSVTILQGVSREVPLDGILQRVGTLEELSAFLLSKGPLRGVHVLVQQLPELIGHVQNLEVLGQLESVLEPLGDISEVVLVPENLADEELLAVHIVIIELLINLLEHGDPLQDVHGIEIIAEVSGPGLVLVLVAVVLAVSLVVAVGPGHGGKEAAHIDQVEDDAEEDEGAQQGQGGRGGGGVEVEEPALGLVQHLGAVEVRGGGHGRAGKQRQQEALGHNPVQFV